ncbi:MAG: cytochrome b N-terminal domain-containing protein, partial [Nitrospinae bacterium]|nr:cytochrome b N-terminal domain-containing protein [Nitrospinota bacterium]
MSAPLRRPATLLPVVLRPGAFLLTRLQRLLDRTFGAGLNPFYYLGAITFFLFWILLGTGAYLFLFYDPSPHGAYPSVERITVDQWWYGGVIRSVHRYASDALMLVIVLHVAQVLFSDRFRRHRWLAWFTGLLILPTVWFEGVTGYLLVWDRVAQYTARMVALLFDAAPINVEPLSRSLLRNDMVAPASLQILNYLHLAIPCLLLLLAWVHCIRVSRPLVRPPWALGVPILLLLLAGSLVVPATSAGPMDLATLVGEAPVDWFYLFPFPVMAASGLPPERLWLLFGVGYAAFVALPWIVRDPKPGRLSGAIPH